MSKKGKKINRQGLQVLPGEGRRFSFNSVKQAVVFYILLLLAFLVLIQLGYHWLGEQFLAWRLQVVEAEPGIMEQENRVRGLVIRIEEVIKSPSDGMILHLAEPGERIPAGSELATVGALSRAALSALRGSEEEEPDEELWHIIQDYWHNIFPSEEVEISTDPPISEPHEAIIVKPADSAFRELLVLYNEEPGFLSYYIDGMEHYDRSFFESAEGFMPDDSEGSFTMEGDLVEAGQPIIKIVDNWQWYFHLTLPLHPGSSLAELDAVDIEFDFAPGQSVRAELFFSRTNENKDEVHLTYLIDKQLSGFDQIRFAEASIRYNSRQGVIIPAEAVFEKDGISGVYLNRGGRVVFEEVRVIERHDENVMVEGLTPYSLVISRPELVEEGRRLN